MYKPIYYRKKWHVVDVRNNYQELRELCGYFGRLIDEDGFEWYGDNKEYLGNEKILTLSGGKKAEETALYLAYCLNNKHKIPKTTQCVAYWQSVLSVLT